MKKVLVLKKRRSSCWRCFQLRNNLLDKIRQDPGLAELLKKHLYQFEDLVYLSPKMLIELLEIS